MAHKHLNTLQLLQTFATVWTGWPTGLSSKNIRYNLSNERFESCGSKRLKYRSRRSGERVFFFLPLKVLVCHVLFKPPSADTPIYGAPWSAIPLCRLSSTQPVSCSSITNSSIHPFPPWSIHPWKSEEQQRGEEMILGEQVYTKNLRGDEGWGTGRGLKEQRERERGWMDGEFCEAIWGKE